MARSTIKTLEARIAELEASFAARAAETKTLLAEAGTLRAEAERLERKLATVPKVAPKGACHVFVGTRKQPYLTALSHSAAYNFMKRAQAKGLHSHYRPVNA